ncbi:aquaporin-like protein [Melanogaster broomeanus]|nr:aquaporin-like protein [Melanogaster broomeanus]
MAHPTVHLRDVAPQPRFMASWERLRHKEAHWLVEMIAEMFGVFLYVYSGTGATAAFIIGSVTGQPLGSLFTIGFAYAIGIVLAVTLCGSTSGGHFHPAVTIVSVIFKGFPIGKAARYIFAQILGCYLTCLIVYVQWKDLITAAEAVLQEKGVYATLMFSPDGPGGIFANFLLPGANLYRALLNEFMTDVVIGLAICGCLDPTNYMIPPAVAPWLIGFTYSVAIWGFSPTSVAANTARDLGGRFMALTIWGKEAAGGPYAAISALTNIPAMVVAVLIYEFFLGSSTRTLAPSHIDYLRAHKKYYEDNNLAPEGYLAALGTDKDATCSGPFDANDVMEVVSKNV